MKKKITNKKPRARIKRFQWLAHIIEKHEFVVGVQVGTGGGNTSGYLLEHCKNLHLIEVAYYPNDGYNNSTEAAKKKWLNRIRRFRDRVTILRGPSCEVAQRVSAGRIDFVFIDGDHSYECVMEDICLWYPKVKQGGLVCGHDYLHPDFPEVTEAVKEFFGDDHKGDAKLDHMWWHWK